MKGLWDWFVTSSADPLKTSLAVRGALVVGVGFVTDLAPSVCAIISAFCFDTAILNPIVDAIVNIVSSTLQIVGSGLLLFGVLRKIKIGRWSAIPRP